ncbi:MAG: phosphotransferase [Deltaproteobacteria bacterium]|nr:phosphotransferase [Deltaproteobacteria bacterium]
MDIRTIAHLGRFKDIVVTLFRYGLDDVVERLDIPGKVLIDRIRRVDRGMSTRERIRHTLEDLGPTFIKFGQIMSLRPDLVPYPLILELRKLQDEVAPVPFPEIRESVETNLRRPIEKVFSEFDPEPLAAASLAQVHRAVLRKGNRKVAVKVRRPKIRRVIEMDLYIMDIIARQLVKRMRESQIYDFPNLVNEIKKTLRRELDFTREARNMKIFRGNFAETSPIRMPALYPEYCTEQMLTMELMEGTKLKDLDPKLLSDREALARRILQFTLKQIVKDGFFHADPHPGNILILEDNEICLLDWGMVGRLTRDSRFDLIELVDAVIGKDAEKAGWVLLQFARRRGSVDRYRIHREIADIMDDFHSRPLKEIHMGHLLLDIANLLRENHLQIPADSAIMIKTMVTAEGTARQLYPELNVVEEFEPYIRMVAKERWYPESLWDGLRRNFYRLMAFQKGLPARLDNIVDLLERGDLSIRFQHENLTGLRRSMERSTNRITLGIIIGALLIGSSMIITTGIGPLLFGFPALGVVGYVVSGLFGLWLIFNIIRGRKF